MVKVWEIELFPDANPLYVRNLEEVATMLAVEAEETSDDCYEVGDEIKIKRCEMTQEEFDNLPEWDGP